MDFLFEEEALKKGFRIIAGTDEAGRGPLCGPVVAGACILPPDCDIPGLNDSKKLSEKKREALFEIITEKAVSQAVGMASPEEIDEINILNASQLAMRRAVEQLSPMPDFVLIDGNVSRGFPMPTETVVGGDAKSPSIAAASILAKVTRDRLLIELDKEYPMLGLAAHKGYPTKAHYEAIHAYLDKFGELPPIYRKSFLKKMH